MMVLRCKFELLARSCPKWGSVVAATLYADSGLLVSHGSGGNGGGEGESMER